MTSPGIFNCASLAMHFPSLPSHHHARPPADPNTMFDERMTFGEKLADRVAAVGGSWGFIVSFGLFLVAWAVVNTVILATRAFDPFPYIFLNLMLSMLAALQAPIIMMSQNRQAAKDRLQAKLDYDVNVQAETEIASLHQKIDLLLARFDCGVDDKPA